MAIKFSEVWFFGGCNYTSLEIKRDYGLKRLEYWIIKHKVNYAVSKLANLMYSISA